MTLRTDKWELDVIVAIAFVATVVSSWLLRRTRRVTRATHGRHLVGAEPELLPLPLAGATFRLVQASAFLVFALILWLVPHPGTVPLLAFYVIGVGSIPLHSFLLLRRQQRAVAKIPPPHAEESQPSAS